MITFAKNFILIRIPPQNDWVVLLIVGCIFLYIFMLRSLRRDSSVWEFLTQKIADSSNNLLSWMIIGIVFCVILSTVLSQYIPIVPARVRDLQVFGYELNKFGFTFFAVTLVFLVKSFFTYLFFAGTGALSRWEMFYFASSKFYFCFSLVLMGFAIAQFFFPVDRLQLFDVILGALSFIFLFKLAYYVLHSQRILPGQWYYKFLYICTLQIVPVLVLLKLLFF